MKKLKRSTPARSSFQHRYTQWNQNPWVQLAAALTSLVAGLIWVLTAITGPHSVRSEGAILAGLFFLGWGILCLSFARRTFRQRLPRRTTRHKR